MKKYTFRNPIEYLKDNPKGYWFKRKLYGYGWVPATWQGFLILILWALVLANSFLLADEYSFNFEEKNLLVLIQVLLLVSLLILVCFGTGERLKWSFGRD